MRIASVVVFHNPEKPAARRELPRLKAWLRKRGVRLLPPSQAARAQLAVALGGDGTLLWAARCLAPWGVPVLGVNVGHLGFLAGTDLKRLYRALEGLRRDKLSLSERMMLRVRPPRGREQLALNDCVIRVSASARAIRLSAWVDRRYLGTYVGDGLILSTPTGSTAYSLAASGPIVEPELDVILLTPICAHSLSQRPVILSPRSDLEIRVEGRGRRESVSLSLDGQVNFPLRVGDRVRVRSASERFRVFSEGRPYFSLLRERLGWGENEQRRGR